VNNRVFEALSCGGVLLSDKFSDLEYLFGDVLSYHEKTGDAYDKALYYISHPSEREMASKRGRELIKEKHTYDHRVNQLIPWLMENMPNFMIPSMRTNKPAILLIYDTSLSGAHLDLEVCLLPTLLTLEDHYRLMVLNVADMVESMVRERMLRAFDDYDLVILHTDSWDSDSRNLMSELAVSTPAFQQQQSKDTRGHQWSSRASLALFVSHDDLSRVPLNETLVYDLIGQPGAMNNLPKDDGLLQSQTTTSQHPNVFRSMCINVAGMREQSEGWNDIPNKYYQHAILVDRTLGYEDFDYINQLYCSSSSNDENAQHQSNVLFVHSSILIEHASSFLKCAIPIKIWSRVEDIATLMRSSHNLHVVGESDGVAFLAGLATGTHVICGYTCLSLCLIFSVNGFFF
jgi:hypothetical protein